MWKASLATSAAGCHRPILLKNSLRDFCPQKCIAYAEIWAISGAELPCISRSNAQISRFLAYGQATLANTDFFNRIGQKQSIY